MKSCFAILSIIMLGSASTQKEPPDATWKDTVRLSNEITEALRVVKDKAIATAVLPKLQAINDQLAALKKKEDTQVRLLAVDAGKLYAKHKDAFVASINARIIERKRIEKLPEAHAILIKELRRFDHTIKMLAIVKAAFVFYAIAQIQHIENAVEKHKRKTGKYPDSLQSLTVGDNPHLSFEDLSDPWGNPYLYNPNGARNSGKIFNVWTKTPDQETIGNWPD